MVAFNAETMQSDRIGPSPRRAVLTSLSWDPHTRWVPESAICPQAPPPGHPPQARGPGPPSRRPLSHLPSPPSTSSVPPLRLLPTPVCLLSFPPLSFAFLVFFSTFPPPAHLVSISTPPGPTCRAPQPLGPAPTQAQPPGFGRGGGQASSAQGALGVLLVAGFQVGAGGLAAVSLEAERRARGRGADGWLGFQAVHCRGVWGVPTLTEGFARLPPAPALSPAGPTHRSPASRLE